MKALGKGVCLGLAMMYGISAFAYEKVTCSRDARPVDGNLIEISITKRSDNTLGANNQYYEVKRRFATAGMVGYSDDNTRRIWSIGCKSSEGKISCTGFTREAGVETTEEDGVKRHTFYMNVDRHSPTSSTERYEFREGDCTFE